MIPATRTSLFASPIEWGFAARALDGQTESGDLHFGTFAGGALIAVIDGLGHGPAAALASQVAAATLDDHLGESVIALVEHGHAALQRTRGAVLSLAASAFNSESPVGWHPQDAADHILRTFGKTTDDALVVVARTVGVRP